MRSETEPRSKSDESRARILNSAVDLFRQRGFESATMREIAAAAGVATGAAYYYFDSKEAIVLAFYDEAQREMAPLSEAALEGSRDLKTRLLALLNVKFESFEPNRRLLGTLAAYANPEHPLSPFGEATRGIRERDIDFFARAVEGSRVKVPDDIRGYLPRLLWMYQMGLILYWIYDRSTGQKRTRILAEKSADVVVQLIRASGFPLLKSLRRKVADMVDTIAE